MSPRYDLVQVLVPEVGSLNDLPPGWLILPEQPVAAKAPPQSHLKPYRPAPLRDIILAALLDSGRVHVDELASKVAVLGYQRKQFAGALAACVHQKLVEETSTKMYRLTAAGKAEHLKYTTVQNTGTSMAHRGTALSDVITFMTKRGGVVTSEEVGQALNISKGTANERLRKLYLQKRVKRQSIGKYTLGGSK